MMRRCAGILLALLTALACVSAAAETDPFMSAAVTEPEQGDMALDDAVAIAMDAFREAMGEPYQKQYDDVMTACFLEMEWEGETRRMWRIALVNGWRDVDDTTCAVAVLSPSGEVAGVEQYKWFDRREAWEAEKGPHPLWSVEDKALFYEVFTKMSADGYADAVPQAHDMPREEAVALAKKALIEQKNADPEELETLMMGSYFLKRLYEDTDDYYQKDFWVIAFVVENLEKSTRFEEVYQVNIASPDGEIYLIYNMHEDGRLNG